MHVRTIAVTTMIIGAILVGACQGSRKGESAAGADGSNPRLDTLLLAAAKVALPPEGLTPGNLPDSGSAGAKVLVTYCTQCHALPSPATHSATDWPSVARRMWLRTEWLPASLHVQVPSMGERYVLLNYLTANALATSDTASLPPGPGRATFVEMCGRCHAVPDPKVHSAEDWPIVYGRMEQNMDRMSVPRPTGGQPAAILEYLRTASGS